MKPRKPLKRSTKPLKRSPLKRKAKRARVLKSGRVILNARGMFLLRTDAFVRSEGTCECHRYKRRGCRKAVDWVNGHLHHLIFKSHGGSDTLENVAFVRQECHDKVHGK